MEPLKSLDHKLDRLTLLEIENRNLKIAVVQNNIKNLQADLKNMQLDLSTVATKALVDAGLTVEEWGIDLDKGIFAKKPQAPNTAV
jgi:uncharacterized small protein (DUF1192 family)